MALIAKICLIGDGKVGKTSLTNRYLGKGFTSEYLPTLGSNFLSKVTQINTESGSKEIRFQIWDLAGQPSFNQIRPLYYRGAIGALLVFDLTVPDSLKNLERWAKEFFANCGLPLIKLIVLGNKVDLKKNIKIFPRTIDQFINNKFFSDGPNLFKGIKYLETSAKTGENVNHVFQVLGESIIEILS